MAEAVVPRFILDWHAGLRAESLSTVIGIPENTAVFSADMINGFLRHGALASERVNSLTAPVVSLFERARAGGVRDIVLLQDTHAADTPEFNSYPTHALSGSAESETIAEILNLPFADRFTIIEKNSLNPAIGTIFDDWLAEHEHLSTAIVVGNCTDLCTYQLAMHLQLRANALNLARFGVVVPEDCVTTFDTREHPADFFHLVFLYHMASNGIRIVRSLT